MTRIVRSRATEESTPVPARMLRSRVAEQPAAAGPVRVRRSPQSAMIGDPGFDESQFFKTEPETACYMVRTRLAGKHPDWYDTYKILNTILKKAQEELERRAPECSVRFELVAWAEEDVVKALAGRKFEKVK